MKPAQTFFDEYAWLVFSGLTIMVSFAITFLPLPMEVHPFLIVLVPMVVAIFMAAVFEGRAEVIALLHKLTQWRVSLKWYVVSLILALGLRLSVGVLGVLVGWIPALQIREWNPVEFAVLALILMIAAIPEELGWRGYVLPKLMARRSALFSSLIVGVSWGILHLCLTLPGMMYQGEPWLGMVLQLVGLSVLITWLYVNTGGNIIITSLFHAAQSFFVIFHEGLAVGEQLWLMAVVYLFAGLNAATWFGPRLKRRMVELSHAPIQK